MIKRLTLTLILSVFIFIGFYKTKDLIPELGWQIKAVLRDRIIFYDPNDTIGDGYLIYSVNPDTSKATIQLNGQIYDAKPQIPQNQIRLERR